MKICRKCETEKPLEEFYQRRGAPDGKRTYCKKCDDARKTIWYQSNRHKSTGYSRKWQKANPEKVLDMHLQREFGISIEDYRALFAEQSGVCAICQGPGKPEKRLSVDHNHNTGKIRGLLCDSCNHSLGLLKESPEVLRRAAEYLEKEFPGTTPGLTTKTTNKK